jgi:thiosulfate/3-mercaptopyruvate sulfurtransferase
MRRLFVPFAAAVSAIFAPLFAAAAFAAQPLLTAPELAARLGDPRLRIVDIRGGKDEAGKTPYELGHIAGSLSAPYSKWRGPPDNPGKLPSAEALTQLVQSLGIDANTPVVVVSSGANETDFGAAARVYWTLKVAGLHDVSLLNGGFKAWRAADGAVTTAARSVAPSNYQVRIDPRLIASQEEVLQATRESSVSLLDARPVAFFTGQTRHAAAKTPGTLVGAKNVDHSVWFKRGSGALLPAADIQRIAAEQGVRTDVPTVSFCNTGHWAATNWFVLSEVLGHPDVKLYPESVVGWSQAGLAMQNVPDRLTQFWLQIKQATGNL